MSDRIHSVGFSISKENLCWVILEEKDDNKIEVKDLDRIPFNSPLDYDNLLNQTNRLKIYESIEKTAISEMFVSLRANLCIDSLLCFLAKIPIDRNLNTQERENQIQWEFNTLMGGENPKEYHLFYHQIEKFSNSELNSIILLFIKKRILSFFTNVFDDLKIPMSVTDIDHFALENACKFSYPEFSSGITSLIFLKESTIEFSLILDGEIFNYRQFKIKKSDSIPELFEKKIIPLFIGMKNKSLHKIYLSGENINDRLMEELTSLSPIDIELVNPFRDCIINKKVMNSPVFNNLNYFAPAMGIALRTG